MTAADIGDGEAEILGLGGDGKGGFGDGSIVGGGGLVEGAADAHIDGDLVSGGALDVDKSVFVPQGADLGAGGGVEMARSEGLDDGGVIQLIRPDDSYQME